MKPVDQTTFGFPGGNCFSACVASILELSLEDVPYFMGTLEDGDEWFDKFENWLARHSLYPVMFKLSIAEDNDWRPSGLHILSGKSPRAKTDEMHSVVADKSKVLHDPHPSRDGILSHDDVVLFAPFDPAPKRAEFLGLGYPNE